jgi:zinc and cadmium transporter
MITSMIPAILAVSFVSLISLFGAALLLLKRTLLNRLMSPMLAISSGVLLGTAFFDLIPESLHLLQDQALPITVSGIIAFFALEKLMQWHHHVDGDHPGEKTPVAYLSLIGDGIHNFIDGVIIGGAFLVSIPLGISVTIAIVAHEIPHELADFTILLHGGFSNSNALLYNFLSATTAIFGTVLVLMMSTIAHSFIPYLISFGAGNFLYIAMSDLIPELHKSDSKKASILQIILLISGMLLMYYLPRE